MKLDLPCERRTFLQVAACFTLSAAALGLDATDTSALPITEGDGQQSGNEVRFPIPVADGVTIDRKVQVIVVRYQSHLYAFNLACPHENNALKWLPKDGRVHERSRDTKHGSARRAKRREHARGRVEQVLSVGQGYGWLDCGDGRSLVRPSAAFHGKVLP
jgi:nitrite reductase/ring-hydroxylating ferredoxin subunit